MCDSKCITSCYNILTLSTTHNPVEIIVFNLSFSIELFEQWTVPLVGRFIASCTINDSTLQRATLANITPPSDLDSKCTKPHIRKIKSHPGVLTFQLTESDNDILCDNSCAVIVWTLMNTYVTEFSCICVTLCTVDSCRWPKYFNTR